MTSRKDILLVATEYTTLRHKSLTDTAFFIYKTYRKAQLFRWSATLSHGMHLVATTLNIVILVFQGDKLWGSK